MKYLLLLLLTAPAFVLAHDMGRYGMGGPRMDTGAAATATGSTEAARRSTVSARPGLFGRTHTQVNPMTEEDVSFSETDLETV